VTYPVLSFGAQQSASSGSETVTLSSSASSGLAVKFSTNQVKLATGGKAFVPMTINSSQSLTPGDYKIHVGAAYGTSSKSLDITVKVVQYLIFEQSNSFGPPNLTVKQGSTVFWINLDSPASVDPEIHDVVFSSGTSAQSPDMAQYNTYSFTFSAPGTYAYHCAFHPPDMKGTIIVTA
jgi:plastocyanin